MTRTGWAVGVSTLAALRFLNLCVILRPEGFGGMVYIVMSPMEEAAMPVRVSLKAIDHFAGRVANVARSCGMSEVSATSKSGFFTVTDGSRGTVGIYYNTDNRAAFAVTQRRFREVLGPPLATEFGPEHVRRTTYQDKHFGFTVSIR